MNTEMTVIGQTKRDRLDEQNKIDKTATNMWCLHRVYVNLCECECECIRMELSETV